ncbi:MAG: FAD-binding oxidoreductase [Dongiaceae bacterium]
MGMSLSRRGLLRAVPAGIVSALAAGAARRGLGAGAQPGGTAWRQLGLLLPGRLLRPGDAGFAAAAQPNNLRFAARLPQAIARCASPEDVASVIGWCREQGLPLRVRAGGHSYAGYSTTDGLLLDVGPMSRVAFDAGTGLITIGAGARNGQVYAALRDSGAAFTHGRCPSAGAGAFLLGGGIGFNMRRQGAACDQLVATELVTADGGRRSATAASDPALFWACRGGGGGQLGVSTSFTLQAFPATPVTAFAIGWTARPEAVGEALLAALDAAPETLGSRVSFGAVTPAQLAAGSDVTIDLIGQLAGSESELRDILAPAFAAAAPARAEIRRMEYWPAQDFLAEPGPPTYYQERSAFVDRPFGAAALAEGFRWLRRWPGTGGYCDLRFFQTGGAMNRVAPDATAFVHRRSRWLMVVGLYWNATDERSPEVLRRGHEWQDAFHGAMLPLAGGGAYVNFPDPSLGAGGPSYYGANLARLARIRTALDPDGVFRFPQSA